MAVPVEPLLHHLQSWLGRANADTRDDAALLESFVSRRDESAFAALLARHGPMVFGVCRRVLRDDHEAEDAFQATFLLLARKAGGLRHPETLAAWLYGAARRLAQTAQRSNSRRRQREKERSDTTSPAASANPLDELSARELLLILDDEMARLPDRYRLPLILCGLEGRSQAEAARLLGWTVDSVRGRLERGRARLRARLVRRGFTLGASLLALESMATATVSAALRQATVRKALTFAAGSTQGIAASVLALAESAVTSMTMTKAKMGLILLLALGLAAGAGVLAYPVPRMKPVAEQQKTAAKTQERKTETPKLASDQAAPTDLYGDPLPSGAIARLGTVRFRHGGSRHFDVLVSPDGGTLISAGGRSIEMWDVQSGRRRRQIAFSEPSPYYVSGIDLSPDGKLLAVNRYEGNQMRFWDLASGAEVHPFGDAAPAAGKAVFSPDGNLLATLDSGAGNPKTVSIWDFRKGKKIRTIEGGEARSWAVRSLAFAPNGNLLAFPRATGVRVWDLAAGKELYQLDPGTKTQMGCVAISPDGKLLAAASNPYAQREDDAIHLWDMAAGKEVGALKGHEDSITALAMSPKSNLLASASRDGTIRFWDLEKRREIGRSPAPSRHFVALRFSADGGVLASGEDTGVLRLWDARKHEETAASAAGGKALRWVSFTPDGQTLISTVWEQIGLWEPLTGRPRRIFNNKFLFDYHPALSPDGRSLATTSHWTQGQALLWEAATGKLVRQFGREDQLYVSSLGFSPDGSCLAGGCYEKDIIRIWDVASGKELQQLKGQHMACSLAFAPDGATLVSASAEANSDNTVRLWKLATGEEIWRKVTRPWTAFDLKFSPDGRTLALVGGMPGQLNTTGEVRLWETATGKELSRCEGHRERVRCVAFSADGRMLATGSLDNTVRLWEVSTARERQCFQGHQNAILSVSFSPDGRLLASASGETTALVWDLTGRFRDGRFQPRRLSAEKLDSCWTDLAHADAARAYRSIVALTGSPKETVAFLKERLSPVKAIEQKRVTLLVAALDSDQFVERDKAMTELEKLGLAVEPALREALKAKPSLEIRRRIEAILEKLAAAPRLRFLRALEVVEHIATPEARQLLESLSQGTAELWPTRDAKASLARLAARAGVKP
ncbi:MAG: sigma-70 family RNA polymerase sigma factor [Gemmataceae bacterium]